MGQSNDAVESQPDPSPARLKARAKRHLLLVRYVFGYLAASFLVSVPLDLGYQLAWNQASAQSVAHVGVSILYGLACLAGFFTLRPLTQIPWERVRVPEFSMFEMRVAAWAAGVASAFLVLALGLALLAPSVAFLVPPRLFWTVLILMLLAWAKIKLQALVFPDFYADRGGERILSYDAAPDSPVKDK
jgi:hypothetical protein